MDFSALCIWTLSCQETSLSASLLTAPILQTVLNPLAASSYGSVTIAEPANMISYQNQTEMKFGAPFFVCVSFDGYDR